MHQFDYQALPWNCIFGAGALNRLSDELAKLGYSRAIVLTTQGQSIQGRNVVNLLGEQAVGLFDRAAMHVPIATVEQAIIQVGQTGADCSISLGGGSTTGLGKILALKKGLPNIAIPTTFAGSEMTDIWGITENGRKVTGRDRAVVPDLVIYDPELIMELPARVVGASGLNAIAQAAVNVGPATINPIVSMMALEAIRLLSSSLPKIIENPKDLAPRFDAQLGASLAGASLGTGATSLHHRLCHTLGGSFSTPHAETHAILLPHSIAYNAMAIPEATSQLAAALGVMDAAEGLFELANAVGAPTSLKELGFREEDLERAAAIATEKPLDNPAPVTEFSILALLRNAYQGLKPSLL